MTDAAGRHWRCERDADGIAWLTFDRADAAVNTLSVEVVAELDAQLLALERAVPRGLVLRSGKPAGFSAGADLREFLRARTTAVELIRGCHSVFDRLEALPCPTLSLIAGHCLGGGLELALATRYRLALDDPRTRLGLPEVRFGIHPAFGGSVRAPRLLGDLPALDLMLSGRMLSARAACRLGLVDYALPQRQLLRAARAMLLDAPPPRRPALLQRLAGRRAARPLIAALLRRRLARRVPAAHYPAPYALLDLWLRHADDPQRLQAEEADSVARLLAGDAAQNLIRTFFLQGRLKAAGGTAGAPVRRVHVVGAGVPGGDIAAWCALHGLEVTLQDESAPRIAPAIARAAALFRAELEQPHQVQAALDRLMPDLHAVGIGRADLVIEAGGDGAAVRPALYRELESRMRPDALLATATADLPLDTLGAALLRPGRLVGLHFFTPVAQVRLVEVVSAPATDAGVSARAAAFVRGIDRLPLPVRSRPGLLVDRVLLPYLLEAVTAVGEGIRPELVDRAALEFGMATGPLEFADAMGLDACLALADLRYGQQRALVPERLLRMVEAGHLGRASGRGFYSYQNGAPLKGALDSAAAPPSDLGERLILRLLNEVVACRRERLVADDDDLDAGLLFGAGFAPFRGGPLHYIRARGVANLKEQLQGLAHAHGERFAPDPGWMEL